MSRLQAVCDLIDELSAAERVEALRRLVVCLDGHVPPGIERTPGVCGGDACVVRTRIPVWVLVRARQLGASDRELLQDYPTLSQGDLDNAWAYYAIHRADIDSQIASNELVTEAEEDRT